MEVIERAFFILNFATCLNFTRLKGDDPVPQDYLIIWPVEKPKG